MLHSLHWLQNVDLAEGRVYHVCNILREFLGYNFVADLRTLKPNKMLSYRRETALQGALVLARSGRLELGDNILRSL